MADPWAVATKWIGLVVSIGALGAYYYFDQSKKNAQRGRTASRSDRRPSLQSLLPGTNEKGAQSDSAKAKKKKQQKKPQAPAEQQAQTAPEIKVQDEKVGKDSDLSMALFAQRMTQAREGSKLAAPKSKEQRVKTVKQSSAQGAPVLSSGSSQAGETGAEADDDLSPVASPAMDGGDVSDMLEPKTSGPTSLRLTAPLKPEKERKQKQAKEQVVESKKARQNRKKVEERRLAREEEEKSRKALEEKQRRAAREARGEPARNGIQVPSAPVNNPWQERNAGVDADARSAVPANAASNGPLLDTFDADSTSSSVDGMKASTTATSESEDQQMARAMKESEDESGWTTVAVPKKQQKKGQDSGNATPQEAPKPKSKPAAPVKPSSISTVSKPSGYAALNVDDPEAWEA